MGFGIVRQLVRWGIPLGLGLATIVWVQWGKLVVSEPSQKRADQTLTDMQQRLMSENPETARKIAELRKQNSDRRPLAVALQVAERRAGQPGIARVVDREAATQLPQEARLAALALRLTEEKDPDRAERMLWAQGSMVQMLRDTGNGADPKSTAGTAAADEHLALLEKLQTNRDDWSATSDDALGVVVWSRVSDPALREFYRREREWLAEPLLQGAAAIETLESDPHSDHSVPHLLAIAAKHHPVFHEAVTAVKEYRHSDSKSGGATGSAADHDVTSDAIPLVWAAFDEYGDVLDRLIGQEKIPVTEVLAIVLANQDYLDEQLKSKSGNDVAVKLLSIRLQSRKVWDAAQTSPLALRLYEKIPADAEAILNKPEFANSDIPAFLFAGYENEIAPAATALRKYGNLALAVLVQYQSSNAFHEHLRKGDVGVRLIPYVAKFSDTGLERLAVNRKWLDKYFDAEGNPLEAEWWTNLPGGALASVARNSAKGLPSEWSEIGWAGVDSAELVLLVASFGASEAAVEATKQGATSAARVIGRSEAKNLVLASGRQAARSGVTRVARSGVPFFERVLGRTGFAIVRTTMRTAMRPIRWVFGAANAVRTRFVSPLLFRARQVAAGWKSVPLVVRRTVYRSLLAAGLVLTLKYRTLPHLPEIANGLVETATNLIKDGVAAVANQVKDAINEMLQPADPGFYGRLRYPVIACVLALLTLFAARRAVIGRRRLQYA